MHNSIRVAAEFCVIWHLGATKWLAASNGLKFISSVWYHFLLQQRCIPHVSSLCYLYTSDRYWTFWLARWRAILRPETFFQKVWCQMLGSSGCDVILSALQPPAQNMHEAWQAVRWWLPRSLTLVSSELRNHMIILAMSERKRLFSWLIKIIRASHN